MSRSFVLTAEGDASRVQVYTSSFVEAGVGFLHEATNVRIAAAFTYNVAETGDGTFTLKLNGVETSTVAEDVSAANLKAAIVAVDDGITADDVTVNGSAGSYYGDDPCVSDEGHRHRHRSVGCHQRLTDCRKTRAGLASWSN